MKMTQDFLTSAFGRVLERFRRRGYADGDSEDCLQEAFCRLWNRRKQIKGDSHAEGLLVKTSRNIRIDMAREHISHPSVGLSEISEPASEPEYDGMEAIYDKVTRLAQEHLSVRDRTILFLRERDGKEFSDIASEMGLTESNVRMIVSRSRKALREIYLKQK